MENFRKILQVETPFIETMAAFTAVPQLCALQDLLF
jgi:hypothetical protein